MAKVTIVFPDGTKEECISFNCPGLEKGKEYHVVGVRSIEDGDLEDLE
jgi:uncharacterized protein (UPF0179 family)